GIRPPHAPVKGPVTRILDHAQGPGHGPGQGPGQGPGSDPGPGSAPAQGQTQPAHVQAQSGTTARRPRYLRTALELPMAQPGAPWFDYEIPPDHEAALGPGAWVIVPWGKTRRLGLVIGLADSSELAAERIRPLAGVVTDAPPAPADWLRLVAFAADYYHR